MVCKDEHYALWGQLQTDTEDEEREELRCFTYRLDYTNGTTVS